MKIAIVKETRNNDQRVSMIPDVIRDLLKDEKNKKMNFVIESGAGNKSGFSDADYISAGAKIAKTKEELYRNADIVSWFKRPEDDIKELHAIPRSALLIGFLDPFKPGNHRETLTKLRIASLSLELLPQTKETENMNAFGAMGSLAGKAAFRDAIKTARSATSKKEPLNVFVIGAGNAGISATQEALKENSNIYVATTSDTRKEYLESQGVKFLQLSDDRDVCDSRECANINIKQQNQIQGIIESFKPDIILLAARRRGLKSRILITEGALVKASAPLVVEDLTASLGGSTPYTKLDNSKTLPGGVIIRNKSNYPSVNPIMASEGYASCLGAVLGHIASKSKGNLSTYDVSQDSLLKESILTHDGKLNNLVTVTAISR